MDNDQTNQSGYTNVNSYYNNVYIILTFIRVIIEEEADTGKKHTEEDREHIKITLIASIQAITITKQRTKITTLKLIRWENNSIK